MVRHLVSLKIRLLRNRSRRAGAGGIVGLVVAYGLAVMLGGLGGLLMIALRTTSPANAANASAGVFLALLLGWTVGPILTLASDNTLDVDRLSLFPLDARDLMPGLLASAAVGPGGLFSVLVLGGALVGSTRSAAQAPAIVVLLLLMLMLCMATSRLVTTSLSAAASKRRWRDFALFLGPVIALFINVGVQIINRRLDNNRLSSESHTPLVASWAKTTMRWVPSGWPAQAIHGVQDGRPLAFTLGLVATAALLVLVVGLWWRAINVATTNPPAPAATSRSERSALVPSFISHLSAPYDALVAKEIRYTWRDPRRRAALLGLLWPALFPLIRLFEDGSNRNARLCLIAVLPIGVLTGNSNHFGYDGDRVWTDIAAGISLRTQLVARTLARVIMVVPMGLVVLAVVAGVTRGYSGVLPALGLMATLVGIDSGYAAIGSVRAAAPLPESNRGNVFGGSGSAGGSPSFAAAMGVTLGGLATVAPFVAATFIAPIDSPLQYVIAAVGIAFGALVWRMSLNSVTKRPLAEVDVLAKVTRV